jgi:hypothetical protein
VDRIARRPDPAHSGEGDTAGIAEDQRRLVIAQFTYEAGRAASALFGRRRDPLESCGLTIIPKGSQTVPDEGLRRELLAMRDEDLRVRAELAAANELGGPYVPRMEEIHVRNAARLKELIERHGWPAEDIAGKDGAEAAWMIAQHAVGDPDLQRRALQRLRRCSEEARVPAWHAAYLEDRIALHEGRPQRYGTQWVDDPRDGRVRPWRLLDPGAVDELRAGVGLPNLAQVPEPGPDLPDDRQEVIRENARWWRAWLAVKGWPVVEST